MADKQPDLPEFSSDDELIDWVATVDLTQLHLEPAPEVQIVRPVTLELDEPWENKTSFTSGAVVQADISPDLVSSS